MIKAVIFDMDGLLIDSEPYWKAAERKIFGDLGIEISDEMAVPTSQMTTSAVTAYWYAKKPWKGKSLDEVEKSVIDKVEELINISGKMLPGVHGILDFFKQKAFGIGLATNAPAKLVPSVLKRLGIGHYFDTIAAADEVISGKPSPDVYMLAARRLGVEPTECIVFEDSAAGMKAAINAGMRVIVVPNACSIADERFKPAHLKIDCLNAFGNAHLMQLSIGSETSAKNK